MKAINKICLRATLLSFLSMLLGGSLGGTAALAAGTRSFVVAHELGMKPGAAAQRANIQMIMPATSTGPVNLGTAGNFVILSKSGITDVPTSGVTGNIGTSPITGAADLLTCAEVTGSVLSVDAAGPAPCNVTAPATLTTAVLDMQAAYTNAAGRPAGVSELGGGNIGGLTLKPGVYKWSSGVNIPTNLTLRGSQNSNRGNLGNVWIFQIAQNLNVASGVSVILSGGAQSKNVFWQVAGQAILGTTSQFQGVLLSKTSIAMQTGASINGRLFAQTAVTLQMNSVSIH